MAGFLDYLIGNAADQIGTFLNAPELGWSEDKAGGTTANSGRVPVAEGVGITTAGQRTAQDAYNKNQGRLANMSFGTETISPNGGLGIGGPANDGLGSMNGLSSISTNGLGGNGMNQGFLNSLLQQAGQGIQQGYDTTMGILNHNRGMLEQDASATRGNIDRQYGQQAQGFQSQLDRSNTRLNNESQDIESNRTDALSDLSSDLRAQMESFSRMLGAMGASDSSAAGMGQYAFGRMGQQARSDIWQQANKLMTDVGRRRTELDSIFSDNMRQLADWKTEALQAVQQDFTQKIGQLEAAKMQADGARLQQLNDVEMQIRQQAMTSAMSVDQRLAQLTQSNKQWAQAQAKSLEGIRNQVAQSLQGIGFGQIDAGQGQTAVNNNFAFGAGDIQRNMGGQGAAMQVALPQNRRDEQAI